MHPPELNQPAINQLALQPDLGIEFVGELQAALQARLRDEAPVALAGDRVERVHAAGLQLLHAFVRDRAAQGLATTITGASPTLVDAARQLALAVSLGLDEPAGKPTVSTTPTAAPSRDAGEGQAQALDRVERRLPNGETA